MASRAGPGLPGRHRAAGYMDYEDDIELGNSSDDASVGEPQQSVEQGGRQQGGRQLGGQNLQQGARARGPQQYGARRQHNQAGRAAPDADDHGGDGQPDDTAQQPASKKARKRVAPPRPKLTLDMLMSQDAQGHGFNHVFNTFPAELRRNFKGKGHEVADLGRLLGMYSRWQRQVFPFCSYDDFIAKLDKLSSSAILKTELRRLRQDLLQLADDERCPAALPEVQPVQASAAATQPAGAHASVPARANSTPAPLPPARHVPQGQWAADDEFDDELADLQGGHIEDIAAMTVLDELQDMGCF